VQLQEISQGKEKESPLQLEGLNISLNNWSDLLYSQDVPKKISFLAQRTKKIVSQKSFFQSFT